MVPQARTYRQNKQTHNRWADWAAAIFALRTGSLNAPSSSGMTGQQRTAQRIISIASPCGDRTPEEVIREHYIAAGRTGRRGNLRPDLLPRFQINQRRAQFSAGLSVTRDCH